MFDFIKNGKGRILELFFRDPAKEYYFREIAKELGQKPGEIQAYLNSLVKEGVLLDRKVANLRFFKLNKEYPLYNEIKSIVSKTLGIEAKLKDLVDGFGSVKYAFIFGSVAASKENSLSDIDLMLIGEVNEDSLIKRINLLEYELKR
jgi:predicted nucleotidyltransferase